MLTGRVTEVVAAPPGPVFALVSDVGRLPEWNEIIQVVVERPATMAQDAEWVVELRVLGYRWQSRSRLIERDQQARHFVYRSQTDDGNPSYAVWSWAVADDPAGSRVTVSWELNPKTFWRRVLLGRIRSRQLRTEVLGSIRAVERAALVTA